jgi:ribosomal protein S18 acetylase RimI-like enzyme
MLVGYALVLLRRTTTLARLYSLAVAPDFQGGGIGRLLLAAAERRAYDVGCTRLRLEVRPDNPAALQCYRTAGYREVGRRSDYYADHSAALRFEKRLADDVPSCRRGQQVQEEAGA